MVTQAEPAQPSNTGDIYWLHMCRRRPSNGHRDFSSYSEGAPCQPALEPL